MKRLAMVAAILAGCGGSDETSRLSPGQQVVTYQKDEHLAIVDYTLREGFKAVDVGLPCVVAEDAGDAGDKNRKVTIRVGEKEPWVGKIRRENLRPIK